MSNLTAFSNAKAVDSKVPGGPMVPSRQIRQATTSPVVQAVPVAAHSTGPMKPAIDSKAPVAPTVPTRQIHQAPAIPATAKPSPAVMVNQNKNTPAISSKPAVGVAANSNPTKP